ncbi:MAG: hypothetical protein CSA35_07490 [Dethiosulfovibrio peptidovorans]|nr:MAG: hypothetical protein CSA35_07490 [Dethiosulfovibrio peptidovorans]
MIGAVQGLYRGTGVILRREISPEGDLDLQILFKKTGSEWCSLPGGGRGSVRLGGSTEPLVWGEFSLYRSRSRSFLKEIEVRRDFWGLRNTPECLSMALRWSRLLSTTLISGHGTDEVLPVLFWSLDLLEQGVPPEGAHLRFLWRLLHRWGLAPSLYRCCRCASPLHHAVWFDDGFLCRRCRPEAETLIPMDLLRRWVLSDRRSILGMRLDDNDTPTVKYVTGKLLNTLSLVY